MWIWTGIAAAIVIGASIAIIAWLHSKRVARASMLAATSTGVFPAVRRDEAETAIPFQSDAIVQINEALYAKAFGVARFDYQILGKHEVVLAAVKSSIGTIMQKQNYLPRRPTSLPKLLRAINSGESKRGEIVRLILQDPVLAGNVLKRANSVFYRQQSNEVVESVDRAVVLMGSEGLRAPVAMSVMQPVFRIPRGIFEQFAPASWEQAQRTATAAEVFAQHHKIGDSFVANLLGLLGGLGRMVVFRLTLDKYKTQSNILPRAEVYIRAMQDHGQEVTRMVAAAWEMSPQFLSAIDEQISQVAPNRMTPLARTLYYANLTGALALLHRADQYSETDAKILLRAHGIDEASLAKIWTAAVNAELN
ncbi:MAG TPA: HDOD domain-containing protein [Steroidobacteraceae bacterium]|nr:HDOD domain-containing protein [Steroidobacteraceae bacterium]